MIRYLLNYHQAQKICRVFQYLLQRDTSADIEPLQIEHVTISPYDELNKYIYLSEYKLVADPHTALKIYSGSLFDVIVVLKTDNKVPVYKNPDTYLDEIGIVFDKVKYLHSDAPLLPE